MKNRVNKAHLFCLWPNNIALKGGRKERIRGSQADDT